MYYRFSGIAGLALILAGCATPQHTNLLIFGTNTQVGLKVGADATQSPSIQVGYNRQELVLMPLLANTGGIGGKLSPCPNVSGSEATPATLPINCKFIGNDGSALDSYSVMASFGAKFDASASTTNPKAGGAIAQYFATGLAARELARHGSALVAATPAAESEAIAGSPEVQAAIRAKKQQATANLPTIRNLRSSVGGKINAAGAGYTALLQTLDKAISLNGNPRTDFVDACNTPDKNACAATVLNGDQLDNLSLDDWKNADKAGG
jgi:hypothetical protein